MNAETCKYCGKLLVINETYTHNKRFCNGLCRNKWQNAHNRQLIIKSCLWCHKTFYALKNQHYCSLQHGEFYRNMSDRITKLNIVDYNFISEIMKLEQLGKNYELPTDKATCREWCSSNE